MSKKAPVGQEGDGNSEKKKSGETLSYITVTLSRFGGSLSFLLEFLVVLKYLRVAEGSILRKYANKNCCEASNGRR